MGDIIDRIDKQLERRAMGNEDLLLEVLTILGEDLDESKLDKGQRALLEKAIECLDQILSEEARYGRG